MKFCTCKAASTEKLQHYWCLYRYNKHKNDSVMGLLIPNEHLDLNFEVNKVVLEKRLNEDDAFDMELAFKPKDVLEIVCHNLDSSKRMVYGFQYKNKKWHWHEINDFYIMGNFDEVLFGKMEN
jgi:hypothetical protein